MNLYYYYEKKTNLKLQSNRSIIIPIERFSVTIKLGISIGLLLCTLIDEIR